MTRLLYILVIVAVLGLFLFVGEIHINITGWAWERDLTQMNIAQGEVNKEFIGALDAINRLNERQTEEILSLRDDLNKTLELMERQAKVQLRLLMSEGERLNATRGLK